jgi:hypothetical protein
MVSMAAKGIFFAFVLAGGILDEIVMPTAKRLCDGLQRRRRVSILYTGSVTIQPKLHLIKGGRS